MGQYVNVGVAATYQTPMKVVLVMMKTGKMRTARVALSQNLMTICGNG